MKKAANRKPVDQTGRFNSFSILGAGEEGFEPSHAGIKIQCLNQLGDSPINLQSNAAAGVRSMKDKPAAAESFAYCCQ